MKLPEDDITPPHSLRNSLQSAERHERWLFVGLFIAVALAPLPLGSNRPLPMAILGAYIGVLLIIWASLWTTNRTSTHPQLRAIKLPLALFFTVSIWVFIQWLPWMPTQLSDPIWAEASRLLDRHLSGRISVNPEATLTSLMHLLTYAGVFWLAFHLTRNAERAWTGIRIIALVGSAYAFYGIIIYMTGNEWILIYPKWTYGESLTSTFVNRNSFATFAGLSFLCTIVLLLQHMKPFFALKHPLRAKIVLITEELVAKAAWKSLLVLSIALSLFLSQSRGGVASTLCGLLAIILIYIAQQRLNKRHIFYITSAFALFTIVIFAASGNHISKRLEVDKVESSLAFRNSMYATVMDAIATSPLTGTGFGTYADVIPAYKPEGNNSALTIWDKAHNTYLENALELGLPAALLLNLSIFLIAAQSARGATNRKRNKLIPALGVGATILVGLHSLVDFSLQIPAVTILYAVIMGIATSQSWNSQRRPAIGET